MPIWPIFMVVLFTIWPIFDTCLANWHFLGLATLAAALCSSPTILSNIQRHFTGAALAANSAASAAETASSRSYTPVAFAKPKEEEESGFLCFFAFFSAFSRFSLLFRRRRFQTLVEPPPSTTFAKVSQKCQPNPFHFQIEEGKNQNP
jgi:hypothetical protein